MSMKIKKLSLSVPWKASSQDRLFLEMKTLDFYMPILLIVFICGGENFLAPSCPSVGLLLVCCHDFMRVPISHNCKSAIIFFLKSAQKNSFFLSQEFKDLQPIRRQYLAAIGR